MTNKIKLIDRLKSWLVTLGIASVFGLAALGVNAANSYQKASAYEYHDNGELSFVINSDYDLNLIADYLLHYGEFDSDNEIYFLNDFNLTFQLDNNSELLLATSSSSDLTINGNEQYSLNFAFDEGIFADIDNYIVFSKSDGLWSIDETYFASLSDYGGFWSSEFYSLPSYNGYQELRNYALSYNAPQNTGNFVTALTSFMSLLGGSIVDLAQTIGAGVVSFASGLFLDSGHLSILGGIIGIFCGIALAVGITSKVYAWVSTLGN